MVNFAKLSNHRRPAQTQGEIEKKPWLAHFAKPTSKQGPSGFSRQQFVGIRLRTALFAIGAMICLVKPVWSALEMNHSCYAGSDSVNLNLALKGEIIESDVSGLQRRLDIVTGKLQPTDGYASLITSPNGHDSSHAHCNAKRVYINATLNSTGGSVDAAIRLGEIIRSAKSNVIVQADAICYSSCVLVLAAAPRRHIESTAKIGIHRPYFRKSLSASYEDMDDTYRKLTTRIENFLSLSGVQPQLASEMMRIPPEQIRILTRAELDDYGLGTDNIAVQEADAMREASKYGVSRQELVRRRQNALRICGPTPCQDIANIDACVMWTFCKDKALKNR
ncbi:MAG: ATP-dependent Clp protease proteolytic subunit [Burkholderiaceae bacterium]|nr:ATP-dependent Clp protease proteolytic subunit [Burkholderiaceae bacterium]